MSQPFITAAVEGDVDAAVARRLIRMAGGQIHKVEGFRGKRFLSQRIASYNQAARFHPWFVLVDFDGDAVCPGELYRIWMPNPGPLMCCRFAVQEAEAWLLADSEALSRFLAVPPLSFCSAPDAVPNPKRFIIDVARRSRKREVVKDLVPRVGSGREVGPAYTSRMIEFIENHWRPQVAEGSSPSLCKCRIRLREFVWRLLASCEHE